jgi:hypothetical protein
VVGSEPLLWWLKRHVATEELLRFLDRCSVTVPVASIYLFASDLTDYFGLG